MTGRELIQYAEAHARTQRGAFDGATLNQLRELAGEKAIYRTDAIYEPHDDTIFVLCRLASLRLDLAERDAELKKNCERALVAMAGAHFCTPQETYGQDIGWAVGDLCRAVGELRPTPAESGRITYRDERQSGVASWCAAAFGADHATSIPQRGIRLAEEAVEAAQAAGCDRAMVHRLVDHVYEKPSGVLSQEIGGVGLTLLALSAAAHVSADAEEEREYLRVKAKPLEHFRKRNEAKNAAGFNVAPFYRGSQTGETPPPDPLMGTREGWHVGSHSPHNLWDGQRHVAMFLRPEDAARFGALMEAVGEVVKGWMNVKSPDPEGLIPPRIDELHLNNALERLAAVYGERKVNTGHCVWCVRNQPFADDNPAWHVVTDEETGISKRAECSVYGERAK